MGAALRRRRRLRTGLVNLVYLLGALGPGLLVPEISVKKALVTPLRARFDVKVEDGPDLRVQGNIVDHEFEIEADGTKIAPGQDDVVDLAVAVAVDAMADGAG